MAPSAITRYRSDVFGSEFKDNYFISFYNTHRINRIRLERDGSTFRSEETLFLESSDPDFRVCDLIEDEDGSLLVIDTGGWFINGCPSAKIAKPEKFGAIYRIRKVGAPKKADARGLALDWTIHSSRELTQRLADSRPIVVDRAVSLLGQSTLQNRVALASALRNSPNESVRLQSIWALARHRSPEARAILRRGFDDSSLTVRLAVMRSVGMGNDTESVLPLLKSLQAESPAERREAASALSRLPQPQAVPFLLEALTTVSDRFLEHALIDALIRLRSPRLTEQGLSSSSPMVRRGALIALDQMDEATLQQEQAGKLLEDSDEAVRMVAIAAVIKRPAWTLEAIGRIRKWLPALLLPEAETEALRRLLSAFWSQEAVRVLAKSALAQTNLPLDRRQMILEVWSESRELTGLADWRYEVNTAIQSSFDPLTRVGFSLIRAAPTNHWKREVTQVALDSHRGISVRMAAAETLADATAPMEESVHEFLLQQCTLSSQSNPVVRLSAARLLGRAPSTVGQLKLRAALTAAVGPIELPAIIKAFEKVSAPHLGLELVEGLKKSPGLEALSGRQLEQISERFGPTVKGAMAPLIARLDRQSVTQVERLRALERKRTPNLMVP